MRYWVGYVSFATVCAVSVGLAAQTPRIDPAEKPPSTVVVRGDAAPTVPDPRPFADRFSEFVGQPPPVTVFNGTDNVTALVADTTIVQADEGPSSSVEMNDEALDQPADQGFSNAAIQRGRIAFQDACTLCHEADRALEKRKSLSGWLATVRRMSQMDGADINQADMRPIATYLASLNPAASQGATPTEGSMMSAMSGSSMSLSATVSTLWRGGNDNLENPGFFADVWVTADWQPAGPVSGRVTACTSCHSDQTGNGGFTLELVEGAARLDLLHSLNKPRIECGQQPHLEAGIKAGRFVVPFGAFAAASHPGVYRTVTNPLMYIMGRSVNPQNSRPPLLPMPYSDEGVNLDTKLRLPCQWTATLDVYGINGLQGFGPGVQFTPSRSYTDNNTEPAVGGRATIGNRAIRLGGSIMSGRMQDDAFGGSPLKYKIAGGDATVRMDDRLRVYFEYAIRDNESAFGVDQTVYGTVTECELLLLSDPKISFLTRYDNQRYYDRNGQDNVERFTWGLNTILPGGSLLLINHERWNFMTELRDTDVVGIRWAATF